MPDFRTLQTLACTLSLAISTTISWSQAASPTTPVPATPPQPASTAAPVDPNQFMRQAADAMSLTAPDMKPWHLRARLNSFALDGTVMHQTTLEEWWLNADHFKISYSSGALQRSEYRVGDASYFTGSNELGYSSWLLSHPLPYPNRLGSETFTSKDASVGANQLRCFTESPIGAGAASKFFSSYCFDSSLPMLRMSLDSYGWRTTWNGLVRIHGHYMAKEIRLSTKARDPLFTIAVDQIDPALGIEESALAPPSDAKRMEHPASIASGVMAGNKLGGDNPTYPALAKNIGAQGEVVVHAKISKDGSVIDAEPVSGPSILQPAALNAVKTWRYHPYLLAGDPIEVETTVNVVFKLDARSPLIIN